ncbi:MAG: hypothetical protein K9J37_00085 [Saprospiraceae bacterium]|nr:hypothetical protein [Saprospiraceae bacterium]MCF8248270.1 hypothetical protein [Saprospiraceae bacterium]MCF8279976.1 hypothetical protein [Bacteroidales bacterium]MCF8309798.1 hypothetical protein [Saprospiraceae bacterium]MCF8438871.1 hypothetical protein [Saprospiraceae bacterium]
MLKFFIPLTLLVLLILPSSITAQDNLTEKGGYVMNANEEHSFLFVLSNRAGDLQELRTGITKYMWKYHPNEKLKITQIQVDGELKEVPLILISGFDNKAKAMEFYNGLKNNRPDFMQMGMTQDYFPLTKSNYEKIVRAKSLNGYKPFFQQNYL